MVFHPEEYQKGEAYREVWYKVRKHEMVFSWKVLSMSAKNKWTKEALAAG